jgi:nucleotide-binding universal stress UspA family protein
MTSATIMLYANPETCEPNSGAAAFAVELAGCLDAHLSVLIPYHSVLAPSWESCSPQEIEQEEARRLQQSKALAGEISADARRENVSVSTQVEWAHAFGLVSFVGEQAKLHDLVITGTDRNQYLSERHIAEHVLFEAGRPVLIVPDNETSFSCERIAVAWDYTRGAARALHDALPLLRLANEVVLIAMGGEKRFQTNMEPEAVVASLEKKGLKARFKRTELQARSIGEALQETAQEAGADLLVMGAYGHSRFREFVLGGATREILDKPRLPVLLSH